MAGTGGRSGARRRRTQRRLGGSPASIDRRAQLGESGGLVAVRRRDIGVGAADRRRRRSGSRDAAPALRDPRRPSASRPDERRAQVGRSATPCRAKALRRGHRERSARSVRSAARSTVPRRGRVVRGCGDRLPRPPSRRPRRRSSVVGHRFGTQWLDAARARIAWRAGAVASGAVATSTSTCARAGVGSRRRRPPADAMPARAHQRAEVVAHPRSSMSAR